MRVALTIFLIIGASLLTAQEIIIQENEAGFCNVDGSVETSVSGYTGDGYADANRGVGVSMSWSLYVPTSGIYQIWWRYANGGALHGRPARMLINGEVYIDTVSFPHTGTWINWTSSDTLDVELTAGDNQIRLESYDPDGLGNYDYFAAVGNNIQPGTCNPFYTLTVEVNNINMGSVSYDPVKSYYEGGSTVTLRAFSNPGYFFQSWSGDVTSNDSVITFNIRDNILVKAIFLPDGTEADPALTGYATVQDDSGTTFITIGGASGDTVSAESYEDLTNYLSSDEPLVVTLSKEISGEGTLKIGSDKTFLGIGDSACLRGIEVEINSARNVILKNLKISHVHAGDAIVITGKSLNVWIDHCDLYSDRNHDQDYYDGLLDIKNESSFITVSWTKFHDHWKTSLISSGDDSRQDTVIRITYHHNYFYNCESRLPSIRFAKAHIFNNYYSNCGTAINSRMNACVRVERNYFENVGKAVFMDFSPIDGGVQLIDNHFGDANYFSEPVCELNVPYKFGSFLDPVEDIPQIILNELPTEVEDIIVTDEFNLAQNYPNPFNPATTIEYKIKNVIVENGYDPSLQPVKLIVYDILGREVAVLVNQGQKPGRYKVVFDGDNLSSGIYIYKLVTPDFMQAKKMILLR
ncbi:MAG: T9SS type A sorting domain-containing protein [Melioribacteraceae bacterium]|nr:T9SS type A sorting domain-containing protein [Melioribacteraceae bacterium]